MLVIVQFPEEAFGEPERLSISAVLGKHAHHMLWVWTDRLLTFWKVQHDGWQPRRDGTGLNS